MKWSLASGRRRRDYTKSHRWRYAKLAYGGTVVMSGWLLEEARAELMSALGIETSRGVTEPRRKPQPRRPKKVVVVSSAYIQRRFGMKV